MSEAKHATPVERVSVKLKTPVIQRGEEKKVGETIEVTPAQKKRFEEQKII